MNDEAPALVWFRADLRLADNEALSQAVASGRPIVACYLLDEAGLAATALGGASRWWLHHSLRALADRIEQAGGRLVLRRGPSGECLERLVAETSAAEIHFNARPEPDEASLEATIRLALEKLGVAVFAHPGALLFSPDSVRNRAGKPFRVFTPFWRACQALPSPAAPLAVPDRLVYFDGTLQSDTLDDWGLTPSRPDWAVGFKAIWAPGEAGAGQRLEAFLDSGIAPYPDARDRPDLDGTSSLSPHLRFGELGPRQVWHVVASYMAVNPAARAGGESFLRQLGWREFSYYLLHHWPTLPTEPFRSEFNAFPWLRDTELLDRWQQGATGYPIVDAGMRQLWHTGWMHNRVRMVAASFLVKHLLIPWQEGAAWFLDTLVDADIANNSASWQWVAGCGADAAPYFRIFNPVLQGKKFDAAGQYVRRWVPELAGVPDKYLHDPWNMPPADLEECGVVLSINYASPIIDHSDARTRALAAYAQLKELMAF